MASAVCGMRATSDLIRTIAVTMAASVTPGPAPGWAESYRLGSEGTVGEVGGPVGRRLDACAGAARGDEGEQAGEDAGGRLRVGEGTVMRRGRRAEVGRERGQLVVGDLAGPQHQAREHGGVE